MKKKNEKEQKKELDLLDKTRSPNQIVWALAWPTIVEQLLMTVVTYVDAAMVGSVGVNATAAIAVNTSVIWLIQGLMTGLGVGASVLVATKIGEKKLEQAQAILMQSILAMIILGIAVMLAGELILAPNLPRWMGAEEALLAPAGQYMRIVAAAFPFQVLLAVGCAIIRGAGDTRTPMFYNILSNVVNIIGNFLFIYEPRTIHIFGFSLKIWGAGMGVGGAALGTAAAFFISGMLTLRHLLSRKSIVSVPGGKSLRPDSVILKQIVRLGLPAAFERVTLSSGQMVITALVTGMGSSVLAAHQLATTAESICYMPCFGFSVAATTLVAQSIGAGEKEMAKNYAGICIRYGIGIMLISAVLMFTFAPQMIWLFIRDTAVISLGAAMLRIEAFAEPFVAVTNVICGVLKGGGDTRWPFYISIIGMWVVRLTLALIAIRGFGMGLAGIWVPMAIDWTVRMLICLWRYKGEKWLHIWEKEHQEAA
ncbi:MAG: MATE family efflux transporter [Firmicutes bacterium]|nr:MATE family efflux transporter [Bacillota bacterium]MDD7602011.1 MATE family efflux transporter [Bacillota bacterium]MDY5856121.1 MATE family efflux transporter [Anaerovoracaceae bacterium]